MKRIAFLDRDGTLIAGTVEDGVPRPHHDADCLAILPGVREACSRLSGAGFALVMVTNQPDVARGRVRRDVVEAMNQRVAAELRLDLTVACFHDDADLCACRKPGAGMLIDAAGQLGITLDRSSVIFGDRWRDIGAGIAAGVVTAFIDNGYAEAMELAVDVRATSFAAAVDAFLTTFSEQEPCHVPSRSTA